jgi:uncharacterized small protein (DUF1192 family)
MLLKSKTLQRAITEIVDVAGIDKRIFALPREVSVKKEKEKKRKAEKSAEAIVLMETSGEG